MKGIRTKLRTGSFAMGGALALSFALGLLLALSAHCPQGEAAAYIGEARAKSIALSHAGVSESAASAVKLSRYDKRGIMRYSVKFLTDDAKYSYAIDASSGEVVAYYRHARKEARPTAVPGSGDQGFIGNERAEAIAFAHAKTSRASVWKFDIELDRHKGRMVYEVEFTTGDNVEHEYKIDALTGEILKWEADYD